MDYHPLRILSYTFLSSIALLFIVSPQSAESLLAQSLDHQQTKMVSLTPTSSPSPTPSPPYQEIGRAYENIGDYEKASDYYVKSIEIDPANTSALNDLERVLSYITNDPRLDLASAYLNNARYQDALKVYLEVLEDTPMKEGVKERAIDSIEAANQVWFKAFREAEQYASNFIAWAAILLCLCLIALVVRLVWKVYYMIRSRKRKDFLILPFENCTGDQKLVGAEQAVRIAIAEWLHLLGASVHVKDEVIDVRQIDLPELSVSGIKIIDWLVSIVRPIPPKNIVDGTLMGRSRALVEDDPKVQIGVGIRSRKTRVARAENITTFWKEVQPEASTSDDLGDYLNLAKQAATWIYNPMKVMSPDAARMLEEANKLAAQGNEFAKIGDKEDAHDSYKNAISLATEAKKIELSFAEPSIGISSFDDEPREAVVLHSGLAGERLELFSKYLEELLK